jgi:hypothetical protein
MCKNKCSYDTRTGCLRWETSHGSGVSKWRLLRCEHMPACHVRRWFAAEKLHWHENCYWFDGFPAYNVKG